MATSSTTRIWARSDILFPSPPDWRPGRAGGQPPDDVVAGRPGGRRGLQAANLAADAHQQFHQSDPVGGAARGRSPFGHWSTKFISSIICQSSIRATRVDKIWQWRHRSRMHYTQLFRQLREARELSIDALAGRAKCHRNTVINVEKGRGVKFDTLADLMAKMGYP